MAPKNQADFVCHMEDVLRVYERPFDPQVPLICLDETTKQLVEEVRDPIAASPGQPERYDYEYRRNGVATLFMLSAPLLGWRQVQIRQGKTRLDYAQCLRMLAEEIFPDARRIVVVQDNLNTHDPCSLYHAFEPKKARELIERFEFHYTPKHASWLNMAECELSALTRQCLHRRIANTAMLTKEIRQWQDQRNRAKVSIDWRFTAEDARIKLKRLYPSYQPC